MRQVGDNIGVYDLYTNVNPTLGTYLIYYYTPQTSERYNRFSPITITQLTSREKREIYSLPHTSGECNM